VRSFIAWVGGKCQLSGTICHLLPEHTCYAEPFAGAGWVLFRKEPAKAEVLNDADSDLINLYLCTKEHHDELLRQLEYLLPSRRIFELFKQQQQGLTDIQRAARFYYVLKNSFGSRISGNPTFGYSRKRPSRFNPERFHKLIAQVHERLQRVFIENLDFAEVFGRYDSDRTCFYCDPPYCGSEDCYREGFGRVDHVRLAGCLRDCDGQWLLSYNDHEWIRDLYEDWPMYHVTTRYTVGQADKQATELLITSRELDSDLRDGAPRDVEPVD